MHRLLVLTALLLGCHHARADRAAAEAPLRVLVWNAHAGTDAGGVDNLERVAARIVAERADIVLLQEMDRGVRRSRGVDQPAELARRTGLHAAFGKSLDYQGGDYGIAVLSRWPVVAHATVPLPVDPPQARSGGLTEPRVALVARLRAPGGDVVVVNTHIDAARDDRWRRQEAARVAAIADSLVRQHPRATVLVGGDMNSEPASAVQAMVRERGLRDAWLGCGVARDVASDTTGRTYPASGPVKRIDYVYLTGAARCRAARVLDDQASDHRALLVDVAR